MLALKCDKEARFKAFRTYEDAYAFSREGPLQHTSSLDRIGGRDIEGTNELIALGKV